MFCVRTRRVERADHIDKERKGKESNNQAMWIGVTMRTKQGTVLTSNQATKQLRNPKICRVRREGHGSPARRRESVLQNHIRHDTSNALQLVFQSTTLVHLGATQFKERKRRLVFDSELGKCGHELRSGKRLTTK